jgi:hypothetical protein
MMRRAVELDTFSEVTYKSSTKRLKLIKFAVFKFFRWHAVPK